MDTNITWEPVSVTNPYTRGSKQCSLCLTEKATIARWDLSLMLNKRSEVMKKCWHKPPHMLNNFLATTKHQPQPPEPDNLTTSHQSSQSQTLVTPPAQDPQDEPPPSPSPSRGLDLPSNPTPVPPNDQPDHGEHPLPLPQRRSTRRKKLVNYQI